MSIRLALVGVLAVAAVIAAAMFGATTSTAPDELACEFVGVSANETPQPRRTPTDAVAVYAADLLAADADVIVANGGVVDVTGAATLGTERIPGTVFAVRDHGRTIAFLTVHRDSGGWSVGTTYAC